MKEFKDKFSNKVMITKEYVDKLLKKKPPVTIIDVEDILLNPDSVKVSNNGNDKRVYYKYDEERQKYQKLAVKRVFLDNGEFEDWIATGHLADKIKESEDYDEDIL
jgi:type II secretory pathway component HofQ